MNNTSIRIVRNSQENISTKAVRLRYGFFLRIPTTRLTNCYNLDIARQTEPVGTFHKILQTLRTAWYYSRIYPIFQISYILRSS